MGNGDRGQDRQLKRLQEKIEAQNKEIARLRGDARNAWAYARRGLAEIREASELLMAGVVYQLGTDAGVGGPRRLILEPDSVVQGKKYRLACMHSSPSVAGFGYLLELVPRSEEELNDAARSF